MRPGRTWLLFAAVSVVLLGVDFAYLKWRERSLEPLSAPIDLTRPGSYTFVAKGFHASRYHPEFNLQLRFHTDVYSWFADDGYAQLWGNSPPQIRIEVHDQNGKTVLQETSALTRSEGWIVTGSPPAPWVEVYKFSEFTAQMFGTYRVDFTVLRGSPNAASHQPRFEIAAIKGYAFLPASLGFVLLVVSLAIAAVVIFVVQLVGARRRRKRAPNPAA